MLLVWSSSSERWRTEKLNTVRGRSSYRWFVKRNFALIQATLFTLVAALWCVFYDKTKSQLYYYVLCLTIDHVEIHLTFSIFVLLYCVWFVLVFIVLCLVQNEVSRGKPHFEPHFGTHNLLLDSLPRNCRYEAIIEFR